MSEKFKGWKMEKFLLLLQYGNQTASIVGHHKNFHDLVTEIDRSIFSNHDFCPIGTFIDNQIIKAASLYALVRKSTFPSGIDFIGKSACSISVHDKSLEEIQLNDLLSHESIYHGVDLSKINFLCAIAQKEFPSVPRISAWKTGGCYTSLPEAMSEHAEFIDLDLLYLQEDRMHFAPFLQSVCDEKHIERINCMDEEARLHQRLAGMAA